MSRRWKKAGLYALLAVVMAIVSVAFWSNQLQGRETWDYSQFIQSVEDKTVVKVSISDDRSRALVTSSDGSQVWVDIPPNDPNLINTLVDNNVDIAVLPKSNERFLLKAAGGLSLIGILLGCVFFFLRALLAES